MAAPEPRGLRAFLNPLGSPDRGAVQFHCRRNGDPAQVVAAIAINDCARFVTIDLTCGPRTMHTAAERLQKFDELLTVLRGARAMFVEECEAAGLLDAPGF